MAIDLGSIGLALGTIIIGSIIIKVLSKYVDKLKDTKVFKQLVKASGYSVAIVWYISYFFKMSGYFIISLIAISFLGFAPQILGLIAVIMTLSIIGVLVYSLRDLIPSAFAGAYILNSRLIKKGDTIQIRGYKGKVIDLTLLNITMKDDKGSVISVPNKIMMEKILKKK